METQRLTLSKEKSVVVHIGNTKKCTLQCPKLFTVKGCTKYLGNFIFSKGGVSETIEDRRKKGWGNISTIMGILEEVDMGANRLEAGLLHIKKHLLPGGACGQDQCKLDVSTLNYAADVV